MATWKLLLAFCGLCLSASAWKSNSEASNDPIVTTKEGKLRGVTGTNFDGEEFYKFLGIPYAKPPVNELRFELAQPIEPWTEVRAANKPGDACVLVDSFTTDVGGSEDCLYLNVYTRNLPSTNSPLKPVMIFIHGGGLTFGSSNPRVYGPEFLMLKEIVLVTLNYRLGVLGFLSFDDPTLGVPGNLGLKDQILALKWVQKNIQSFNGDPKQVTLFGNSAGASSIHAHILSAASRGLFHKAILQSGCALNSWFWGSKNNARELVKTAGTDREALDVLKNNMSFAEIFQAQNQIYDSPYPAGRRPFSAVIEAPNEASGFLTKNPVDIIKEGSYNQVPIMMGYVKTEGMLLDFDEMFTSKMGLKLPPLSLDKVIPFNLNVSTANDRKEIVATLKHLYKGDSVNDKRYDPMTDGYLLVAIVEALRQHLKTTTKPIYLYTVSLEGELNLLKRILNRTDEPGVNHSDELGYLFNTEITPPIKPGSLEDRSLRSFVELWTNFAIHGNPTPPCNGKLKVHWTPVESEEYLKVLDIGEKLEMKDDIPERHRINVWWKILKKWPLVKFS